MDTLCATTLAVRPPGRYSDLLGPRDRTPDDRSQVAVLMVDLDGPTTDHRAGTRGVLARVRRVLRESVGPAGVVARFGGTGFVALVPVDVVDEAQQVAEAVRGSIADLDEGTDEPVPVTVSVGAAVGPVPAQPDDDGTGCPFPLGATTMWAADNALYAAKRAGGNAVRIANRNDLTA